MVVLVLFFVTEQFDKKNDNVSRMHADSTYLHYVEYFWQSLKKKPQRLCNLKFLIKALHFFEAKRGELNF